MSEDFDHIVGLGGFCRTAHQLRRLSGVDAAHVFDWWVTTSPALVAVLEDGFRDLFRQENMRIDLGDPLAKSVVCARYGLWHYHDFDEALIDGAPHPLLVRQECSRNLAKYAALVRRFLAVSGRLLLVRDCGDFRLLHGKRTDLDEPEQGRLLAALDRLLPGADWRLLLLNSALPDTGDPRVVRDVIDSHGCTVWEDSDLGWNEMAQRQGIRPRRPVNAALPAAE